MTTSQENRCCFLCTETVTLVQFESVSKKCPNFRVYILKYLSVNKDFKILSNFTGTESNKIESGHSDDPGHKEENVNLYACSRCLYRVKMFCNMYENWQDAGNRLRESFIELKNISIDAHKTNPSDEIPSGLNDEMKAPFIERLFSKAHYNKNENENEAEDSATQNFPDDHGERNESGEHSQTQQETSTSLLSPLAAEADHPRLIVSSGTQLNDKAEESSGPSSAEPPYHCSSCDLKFWSKYVLDDHTNQHIQKGISQSFQILRKRRKTSMATKKYLMLGKFAATKQERRSCPPRRKFLAKKLLQRYSQNGGNTTCQNQNRASDFNQNSENSIQGEGQIQDVQEEFNNCELNSDAMSSKDMNSQQQSSSQLLQSDADDHGGVQEHNENTVSVL